jgi:hypothetical protein
VIAACAAHVPLRRIPAHVVVIRDGRRLVAPHRRKGASRAPRLYLKAGDELRVGRRTILRLSYAGNRFGIADGSFTLTCRRPAIAPAPRRPRTGVLALELTSGRVHVRAGDRSRRAVVLSRELQAFAPQPATTFVVERSARAKRSTAWTLDRRLVVARGSDPAVRIDTRLAYTAISDARGLRLDIWPFAISRLQRPTTPADRLTPYWADGLPCSAGCTPPGAIPGWPLKPFHQQHAIRAGINELRPANFHVAVDIEARDFEPVYAIQSGIAHIRYAGEQDVNVDVGRFFYWHVNPTVSEGQWVNAYTTQLGTILYGAHHLALSEGTTDDYLNPLRPGGSLQPYRDHDPPIIGVPRLFADGSAIVRAFDPQGFVGSAHYYETPVLAPSSLAWRLYTARGRPLTGLMWAMRGSQNLPSVLKPVIFAPGASNPGYRCFFDHRRCIPNWVYRLAGGLTEPLPLAGLRPGRYRLTVYAWDWAGNTSALDDWITLPLGRGATAVAAGEFGPLAPRFDYP